MCAESLFMSIDFNPPAPCGAGRAKPYKAYGDMWISIHPPRAGRD